MKISEEIKQKNVGFMTGGIENTIKTFGKRAPCSTGEREAQAHFADEMSGYMDKVQTQKFTCHPDAFMGWIPITATCMLLGLLLYFFVPIASIPLFLFGLFCMISQLVLYKEWVDPLFPKKESQNVYATKTPEGEVKRRIVLCGHADAAYEWHWHYKYGCIGFYGVLAGTVVGSFYMFAIAVAKICAKQFFGLPELDTYLWIGLADIPMIAFFIACYFYSDKKTIVDGANDNLTACYMSMAAAKLIKDENIRLENTELGVLLTGCEEAGLRGARAFCKAHKADFEDVETVFLCFETLYDEKHLSVYKSEIFGFYKTDVGVANFVKDVGEKRGLDIKVVDVSVGTDNAAFGEAKMKSTCIAALDEIKIGRYYHTRLDTYDNLNPKLLGDVLELTLDCIKTFDKQGLQV